MSGVGMGGDGDLGDLVNLGDFGMFFSFDASDRELLDVMGIEENGVSVSVVGELRFESCDS